MININLYLDFPRDILKGYHAVPSDLLAMSRLHKLMVLMRRYQLS